MEVNVLVAIMKFQAAQIMLSNNGIVLIKQTSNAKSVEIWKAGTLELVAIITSK